MIATLIVVLCLLIQMYQGQGTMPQPVYPAEMASAAYPYSHQPQASPLQSIVTSGLESQLAPLYGLSGAPSQVKNATMISESFIFRRD